MIASRHQIAMSVQKVPNFPIAPCSHSLGGDRKPIGWKQGEIIVDTSKSPVFHRRKKFGLVSLVNGALLSSESSRVELLERRMLHSVLGQISSEQAWEIATSFWVVLVSLAAIL